MAIEQDWADYADQAFLGLTDTLLARTAAGAGVEVAGQHLLARRTGGGRFSGTGGLDLLSVAGATLSIVPDTFSGANGVLYQTSFAAGGNGPHRFQGTFLAVLPATGAGAVCNITPDGTAGSNGVLMEATFISGGYGPFIFRTNGTNRLVVEAGGATRPAADNTYTLGNASFRWSIVYAATGTINTSDEREKVWRGTMTAAEVRAAKRIIGELGFYQWADAVAEKGNAARYHFGARAQRVWVIMAEEGLVDPITAGRPGATAYAFLCFDEWEQLTEERATYSDTVIGPDKTPALISKETVVVRQAGDRFGLRVDQLVLFLIAAQEQRLAALEAAA